MMLARFVSVNWSQGLLDRILPNLPWSSSRPFSPHFPLYNSPHLPLLSYSIKIPESLQPGLPQLQGDWRLAQSLSDVDISHHVLPSDARDTPQHPRLKRIQSPLLGPTLLHRISVQSMPRRRVHFVLLLLKPAMLNRSSSTQFLIENMSILRKI